MLCDDCGNLIWDADTAIFSGEAPETLKREVTTNVFQSSIDGKCYLCTRLLVMLGHEKWHHILHDLPAANLVTFDKSAAHDAPHLIHIRLGCKLTPILRRDEHGCPDVFGNGYSYGYLQIALLPLHQRSASLYSQALNIQCTCLPPVWLELTIEAHLLSSMLLLQPRTQPQVPTSKCSISSVIGFKPALPRESIISAWICSNDRKCILHD
jgi:hypothetical protein